MFCAKPERLLLLGLSLGLSQPLRAAPPPPTVLPQYLPITARMQVGAQTIGLEVASTPQQQERGLMARPPLAPNRGMIFLFQPARPVQFWMWQTPAPLDMLFLRQGQVKAIFAAVPPCFTQPCPTYGPALQSIDAVVELRAGRAKELGLKPGDRLLLEPIPPISPGAAPTR